MLLTTSLTLIDKEQEPGARDSAAWALGERVHHTYAMPALIAVLRDHTDEPSVRQRCVIVLGESGDQRAVDVLIEALFDPSYNVASEADYRLGEMTHWPLPISEPLGRDPNSDYRCARYEAWRDWWRKNRGKARVQPSLWSR
jgi:HEAT repeat protein